MFDNTLHYRNQLKPTENKNDFSFYARLIGCFAAQQADSTQHSSEINQLSPRKGGIGSDVGHESQNECRKHAIDRTWWMGMYD